MFLGEHQIKVADIKIWYHVQCNCHDVVILILMNYCEKLLRAWSHCMVIDLKINIYLFLSCFLLSFILFEKIIKNWQLLIINFILQNLPKPDFVHLQLNTKHFLKFLPYLLHIEHKLPLSLLFLPPSPCISPQTF